MESRGTYLIRVLYFLVDVILINAWYFSSAWLRYQEETLQVLALNYYQQLLVVLNLTWLMLEFAQRFYSFERTEKFASTFLRLIKITFWFFILLTTYIFVFKEYDFSRLFMAYYFSGLFVLLTIWRWSAFQVVKLYRRKGGNHRHLILVGTNSRKNEFVEQVLNNKDYGFAVSASFDSAEELNAKSLEKLIQQKRADELIAFVSKETSEPSTIIRLADHLGVRLRLIPDLAYLGARRVKLNFTENIPVLTPRREPLSLWHNQLLKRSIDVVLSTILFFIVFTWLFPLLGILIKLGSKGPVFYIQKRSGIGNEVIRCIKFRTMIANNPQPEAQATRNDNRITGIGRWLRKTSLDELPQFLNVLKGDMSIVGPRPHMLIHTQKYAQKVEAFLVRHSVKPGITGLAQVKGYRGEIKGDEDLEKRVYYDVLYLENWNLMTDVKIMLHTGWKLLVGDEQAY